MKSENFLGYGYGWLPDPNMWTPWGAPAAGDSLFVTHGIPFLGDGTFGAEAFSFSPTAIHLVGPVGSDSPPALLMWNESLQAVHIDNTIGTPNDYSPRIGQVVIADQVTLNTHSSITAMSNTPNPGTAMYVWDSKNSTLTNNGSMSANPEALLNIDGGTGSKIINNGVIEANGGTVNVNSDVLGTGNIWSTVAYMRGGSVILDKVVGSGQTLHVAVGGSITLKDPTEFSGIADVGPSQGTLNLQGLQAASWADIANTSLVELFNSAGTPIDVINMIPQAAGQLTMRSYSSGGGGVSIYEQHLNPGQIAAAQGVVLTQTS